MSPRSSKDFEQIRKSRRDSILNAALRLFAENGYRATSMSQIAENAGVAKGLIYNYFDSKEQLLEQVIQKGFDSCMPEIRQEEFSNSAPETIFKDTLYMMKESFKNHPHFWQLYARLLMQVYENQSLLKRMDQYSRKYYDYLGNLLVKLNIPEVQTETFKLAALLDGILLHYLAVEKYPLDDVVDSIINEYLNKYKAS
ncbi:MAG TPA: TetR/AcrR family transcriptional regulator [Balneolales bacterium]|nr:TetR/AcrR family transcriptional regulator [Balneolales bacterium]